MLPILIGALLAQSAPPTAPPTAPRSAPQTALHAQWRVCTARKTTNYDFDRCGGAYVKAADGRLNATWTRLMAAVAQEPQTRAALLTEQRTWLAYRNTACAFYGIQADWGREGEVLDAPECVGGVLERRTAELATYLAFVGPKGEGSR